MHKPVNNQISNIKYPVSAIAISFLFLPVVVFAQSDFIVCSGGDCDINSLVTLIQNVINWIIMVSAPVAMILFGYAGVLMITAGGKQGQIDKARGIFKNVLIGFIFILAAWLIVYTITNTLLEDPGSLPVQLEQ